MTIKPNEIQLRIIKRKVENIRKMEERYWNEINEQRQKVEKVNPIISVKFQNQFPKTHTSLIYGCLDGAVLIRYCDITNPSIIKVEIKNCWLVQLIKQIPFPYFDTEHTSMGLVYKLVPESSVNIDQMVINGNIELRDFRLFSFHYNKDEKLIEWEDALYDIKIALLSANLDLSKQKNASKFDETKSIISELTRIKQNFDELLNSSTREEELQIFLKENPLIIQPYSTVYPKQRLGDDYITDFVFANSLDQGIKYTFVEIEKATMPIFTMAGEFSSDFTHAQKQTLDWETWLDKNLSYLREKLPGLEKPSFVIIAGRSTNFSQKNQESLRAWNRRNNNVEFLTFDDISVIFDELITNLKAIQQQKCT